MTSPTPLSQNPTLGVLLPTLNCRHLMEAQIRELNLCTDLINEITVVDSHSEDDTLDFLKNSLKHPRLRFLQHPRGLYQSWNAGISTLSSEYVLIATAGDAISRQGLSHLLETAARHRADVVLSPPRMLYSDGRPEAKGNWPIHKILEERNATAPFAATPDEVRQWTFFYAGKRQSLLGSSASNLYRTELLQAHPFPTDVGGSGDLIWGITRLPACKVAITPQRCAEFVFHPGSASANAPNRDSRPAVLAAICNMTGVDPTPFADLIPKLDDRRKWRNEFDWMKKQKRAPWRTLPKTWHAWRHWRRVSQEISQLATIHGSKELLCFFEQFTAP